MEPISRIGGLAMMWKEKDQAILNSYSMNPIDIQVHVGEAREWRLMGFFGEPNRPQRRKTWDLLRNLARDSNLPWYVIGDLNNVISQDDKRGGVAYPN